MISMEFQRAARRNGCFRITYGSVKRAMTCKRDRTGRRFVRSDESCRDEATIARVANGATAERLIGQMSGGGGADADFRGQAGRWRVRMHSIQFVRCSSSPSGWL